MDAVGTMEVAALGRPFCLGMLYDCRSDLLVPGLTLWDPEDLKKDIIEEPQKYSAFEIVASESIEDKSSALNVEASLKASFLGGLVEVGGSGKYLNDKKASKYQAMVTLQYKATTKFKELTMSQLGGGNVKHPYVFDKGIATHVVTAITYGAQAFFVFDRSVSEKEDHQDIQGNLNMMIKKIPNLVIDGEGSLDMEDEDIAKVEKFSCKFYGDFSLPKPPSSFKDAVEVYQNLPTLLGVDRENTVPMRVWLLPLTSLGSTAARLVRQISIGLVQEVQRVLEDFSELEMRCSDALRTATAQHFPQVGKKLKSFKQMCFVFKLEFQQNLAKKLPSIRGGGEEEAALAEILTKMQSSPFNSENLNAWMDCKESEMRVLKSFTNMMKNTTIVPSQDGLHEEALCAEQAVCFVFTSLGGAEPSLSALSNYLKGTTEPDDPQHPHHAEKEQWHRSKQELDTVRMKAKLFRDFAEANKENKKITFLMLGSTNDTHKGSSIYLYKDGCSLSENFQPPSKPEAVTVSDINHDSVTLKITPPTCGAENITSYSVEYCVSGEDGWQLKTTSKADEVTVSDLRPNTKYVFRCRAVTSVGVGPANEVNESVTTLPCTTEVSRLKEFLKRTSKKMNSSECPSVYKLPLTEDYVGMAGVRRFHFGKESVRKNRTVFLVGVPGSQRSTLIDGMINYIVGVEWKDDFRFTLFDESQTSDVNMYRINHQDGFKIDHSLTIVDIGDIESDSDADADADTDADSDSDADTGDFESLMEFLYDLVYTELGLKEVDAPCFVAPAPLVRLTPTQGQLLKLAAIIFGTDMEENLRILVTSADSQRPPVLQAIINAGVLCPKGEDGRPLHFKFNNSALFAHKKSSAAESRSRDGDEENYDQMFWNFGSKSMKMFFDALNEMEPKSLAKMFKDFREEKQLQIQQFLGLALKLMSTGDALQ